VEGSELILFLLALCSFNGQNIVTAKTPVSYRDASQGTWVQSFQAVLGTASPTTTVIVLPGGPGATTITPNLPSRYLGMPARWNAILTDPRGAGCNVGPPSSTFSTDTLARDILTIIKQVQITDYIIFGASYGTEEATVLATLIEADPSVARPRAIVLEGTIGHAWNGYEEYFQGFINQWERLKRSVLQPSTVAQFAGPTYPLGLSSSDWALIIASQLAVGDTPGSGQSLRALLEPMNEPAIRGTLAAVRAAAAQTAPLILTINCGELTGNLRPGDLSGNRLVLGSTNLCPGGFTNRYDSASFQTSVPIYYFQGQDDPIVGSAQSMYHFLTHGGSRRSYVTIGNAGHEPFLRSLSAVGCAEAIWSTMGAGGSLEPVIGSCGLPYTVLERGPGQPALPSS
jgi:pimeloyl-ACP methyl ester carboxylesterase